MVIIDRASIICDEDLLQMVIRVDMRPRERAESDLIGREKASAPSSHCRLLFWQAPNRPRIERPVAVSTAETPSPGPVLPSDASLVAAFPDSGIRGQTHPLTIRNAPDASGGSTAADAAVAAWPP